MNLSDLFEYLFDNKRFLIKKNNLINLDILGFKCQLLMLKECC